MIDDDQAPRAEASLRDILEAARRRLRPIVIAFVVGLVLTLALALLLPPSYRSVGTILIEQQELPTDLVRSTVTSYADQRIQIISQRVMTTQRLLEVISKYGLYPGVREKESREELIDRMREDIDLEMISANVIDPRSGAPQKATIAFSVSYSSRSPESAFRVANEITTLYLNENLTSRARVAQDASGFLTAEGERLKKSVAAIESSLAAFKEQNADALPENAQLNLTMLARTEQELRDAQSRMSVLDQQMVILQSQLALAKPYDVIIAETGERILSAADRLRVARSQLAAALGNYGEGHPDIRRLRLQIASLELERGATQDAGDLATRIEDGESQLAALRLRYADDHPDVRLLTRAVETLKAEAASAAGAATRQETALPQSAMAATDALVPDNPAFVQLQTQIAASSIDRSEVVRQMAELRARIQGYERQIAASPQTDRRYRELIRELQNSQVKYQDIRAKQMEAEVSENLESDRKGERFTLIEPPLPPGRPQSPNRPLILGLGVLLSIGLALAIAAVLETMDRTIRGSRDLLQLAAVRPLAIVPRIRTLAEIKTAVRRRQHALVGAVAGSFVFAALVHLLYRPLDLLWFTALRRMGI